MIWDIILEDLKKSVPLGEYNKYIKNLRFDEKNSASDMKILIADNIFVSNWVKRKYMEKIALLFESKTEIKTKIKIVVESKYKKSPKQSTQYDKKFIQNNKKIINPSFTFDNFVVGESNRFAFTLAQEVAKNPGELYNPLFISSDTGLGKTHLLNAIGNYNINKKNIVLTTSEEFLNDFTAHLKNQNMDRFHEKYRQCDCLLIDDIQFLCGKEQTQEELFHTFNYLKQNNKQIVLTSDKEIKYLNGMEERLKSRFQSGLVAQIHHPELETKTAIIKKKCEIDLIQMNDEIILYIATNINNNIREIEGILQQINAYASILSDGNITLDFAKNIIKSYKKADTENINIDEIIKITAKSLNIKPTDIKNKRTKEVRFARKIVIFLARKLTKNSMIELANLLGTKNHSAISKAMKKIQEEIEINEILKSKIEEIENKIKDDKNK